jgi:hypothetical protein
MQINIDPGHPDHRAAYNKILNLVEQLNQKSQSISLHRSLVIERLIRQFNCRDIDIYDFQRQLGHVFPELNLQQHNGVA